MVTEADQNDLASLVLGTGRTLLALVSDQSNEKRVAGEVDLAGLGAMKHGWFGELGTPDVKIGGVVLPASIPEHNVPQGVRDELVEAEGVFDEESDAETLAPLQVARGRAEEHGFEIKVSCVRTHVLDRFCCMMTHCCSTACCLS